MGIKAVIFDLFETLVDFSFEEYDGVISRIASCAGAGESAFVDAWHEEWPLLEAGNFETPEDFIVHVSARLDIVPDGAALEKGARIHGEIERKLLNPRVDALAVLRELRRMRAPTGMVTNCAIETPHYWKDSALSGLIDAAVFSTLEKIRKPDPEIFLRCARLLGAPAGRCMFVGDGANNELQSARRAGMTAVLLNNGCSSSRKKMSEWDGAVIHSLLEIPELLDKVS